MNTQITDDMIEAVARVIYPGPLELHRFPSPVRDNARCVLVAVLPLIEESVAIRSAELFKDAWDDGNALGLDGWTGPGRGSEPDQYAIDRREKMVDKLVGRLHGVYPESGHKK